MPLQINLLHEQIAEKRQRQRDPLKLSMYALAGVGTIMALVYMWRGYQTLEVKGRLADVQKEWAKIEPRMVAAQKRSAELTIMIGTTRILDEMIEGRFYWAPILQSISRSVAPNVQLTALDGSLTEDAKVATLVLEGTAAGREPRAAAEDFRQLLSEQIGKTYSDVKVEFRVLEDLDTIIKVSGTNMAMARFTVAAVFTNPHAMSAPTPAPRKARGAKEE